MRAVESPLVRGGLTIGIGLLAGNVVGFFRVALTAYLLGTHSLADSLAVALGPLDTLNSVLINSVIFAFVPMLTARRGDDRVALFAQLNRFFTWLFTAVTAAVVIAAPWLIRALAPGLERAYFPAAVTNLRIIAFSTMAAGVAAVHSALLYTDRRFAPSAFYQACLNFFTIAAALSLWKMLGVHAFAVGYAFGAWVQLAVVWYSTRGTLAGRRPEPGPSTWREILAKPLAIMLFTAGIAANIVFTRAFATQAGPGMAAALDYCMRGVGVPLALLVSPLSNSLLPEIARLRSQFQLRQAFRLIDRTIGLAALAAVACCAVALTFRVPAIRLLFERGSFTPDSTRMVAAVFLGMGPAMIGWSLLELTSRSLFSLDRSWLPAVAAIIPLLVNAGLTAAVGSTAPQFVGLGASAGFLAGFAVLFGLMRARRGAWVAQAVPSPGMSGSE